MTQLSFGTVAPTSRRAVAYIIDALIAAGIGIVLATILLIVAVSAGTDGMLAVVGVGAPIVWLLMIGWFVFYTFMQSGKGSIGMRVQGLRLAREADGAPLGFGKTLLRNIIFGLAASIVVGYFTPLFDGSGRFQGWHDKVARSVMLDARAAGGTASAPPTQALHVPQRPSRPNEAPVAPRLAGPLSTPTVPSSPQTPAIPGLAAPTPTASYAAPSAPVYPGAVNSPAAGSSAPALDETIRAVDAPARPAAPVPHSSARPPAPIAHPAAPTAGGDALIAFVPGITQDGPPERNTPAPAEPAPEAPAAAPVPETAPAAAPTAPASDSSDDVSDLEDTRISIPGHRLVFTWDDGTKVTVSRRTLFGRNPAPEDGAAVVSVRDETLSLSKTHFEAAAESAGGWIMDRHSTNGTIIVRDGHRITCAPGEQVRIRLGDAIEIGDRIVTIGGYA